MTQAGIPATVVSNDSLVQSAVEEAGAQFIIKTGRLGFLTAALAEVHS